MGIPPSLFYYAHAPCPLLDWGVRTRLDLYQPAIWGLPCFSKAQGAKPGRLRLPNARLPLTRVRLSKPQVDCAIAVHVTRGLVRYQLQEVSSATYTVAPSCAHVASPTRDRLKLLIVEYMVLGWPGFHYPSLSVSAYIVARKIHCGSQPRSSSPIYSTRDRLKRL